MQAQPATDLGLTQIIPAHAARGDDYAKVKRVIEFLSTGWREQPTAQDIANAMGLDISEVTALFRQWCGLTPKSFVQALTLDYTRGLLRTGHSVLDTAYAAGLSGPSRLHDLYITHEAMSPGDYKSGGAGLDLKYGFHPSPFGESLVVIAPHGLAALGWVDAEDGSDHSKIWACQADGQKAALSDMRARWPNARLVEAPADTAAYARRVFDPALWRPDQRLRIVLIGSDFELRVWETLLKIPFGKAQTYGSIAERIGRPNAARAVGAAVGRNPISFVVPCHRVVGKSGALTGYHWGLTRKRAILGWEAGHAGRLQA